VLDDNDPASVLEFIVWLYEFYRCSIIVLSLKIIYWVFNEVAYMQQKKVIEFLLGIIFRCCISLTSLKCCKNVT
jgi:hypothetical protein